jgi:hypothetical protein
MKRLADHPVRHPCSFLDLLHDLHNLPYRLLPIKRFFLEPRSRNVS